MRTRYFSECDSTCPVENLEVSPVVEDAAAGAGEDAPIRPGRVLLQVLDEECNQFGMEGHATGFSRVAGA